MDQDDQQRIFARELDRLVDRARGELDLTTASILGVLQTQSLLIFSEAERECRQEDEEE